MTLLHTFTDRIPKDRLTLITDFIAGAKPFGIVKSSNAIGTPTDVYSNDNSDVLGRVTCTLATGTGAGAGVFQRIGIYQTADQSASIISRAWSLLKGDYAMEARLKTTVHPSAGCIVTCGYTLNHNTLLQNGAYFYHTNGQSTWRAAVSAENAIVREMDTGVSVEQYRTLRVVSLDRARAFEFYIDGRRVWKSVDFNIRNEIESAGAYPMPCIEIRDRVAGGGGRDNSFTADYMMTEERFVR
jgi:hypothetical protein